MTVNDVKKLANEASSQSVAKLIEIVTDESYDPRMRAFIIAVLDDKFIPSREIWDSVEGSTIEFSDYVRFLKNSTLSDIERWLALRAQGIGTRDLRLNERLGVESTSYRLILYDHHFDDNGKRAVIEMNLGEIIAAFNAHPSISSIRTSDYDPSLDITIHHTASGHAVICRFWDEANQERILAITRDGEVIEGMPRRTAKSSQSKIP